MLQNPDYPSDRELIVQELLEQVRTPEEVAFLQEIGETRLVASIRGLALDESTKDVKGTFDTLPLWLQQKYGETFSNDLPPRSSSLDNVPVKQETQIQENARLPWFQLFPEDLEQVHRNFARNAINDQKFLFPYR